jgi:hypothetical protein
MEPSASAAVALIVIPAGALNLALFIGLVILTVGAVFEADTETLIAEEVLVSELLSVAFAVSE